MDNQHRKITGYRELDESEIAQMNEIKDLGVQLGEMLNIMKGSSSLDQRWVAIGKTHMQEGLMALTRAVAQPTTF